MELKIFWNYILYIFEASLLVWKTQRAYSFILGFLTIVHGLLPSIQLWISKLLIDTVVTLIQGQASSHGFWDLLNLSAAYVFFLLLSPVALTLQETYRQLLVELVTHRVNNQIIVKANKLPFPFFEDDKFYNLLQNAYAEAGHRPLTIITNLLSTAQSLITLTSLYFILSRLHSAIFPIIIIFTIPILLVQSKFGHHNYWIQRQRAPEARKQAYIGSLLTSDWYIKEIRLFKLESHFLQMYEEIFSKFYKENRHLLTKQTVARLWASLVAFAGRFVVFIYVLLRASMRTLSVGDFALYIQSISIVQEQIQSILMSISRLYTNALFISNLFEFLSIPAPDSSTRKEWTESLQDLEFRDVSFRYPATENLVLKNISFRITRGHSLALVGKNGAGKTTIAKLICGFYKPTSGEILINGKNINDYSPLSIQRHIASLFQDYGRYHFTARENIGIGDIAHLDNLSDIKAAAQKGNAHSFIELLPQKYESTLGKRFKNGTELSTGQWQKLALSRVFYKKAGLLILDEPTASLDSQAEAEVFETVVEDNSERITILISHRFSTIQMADKIVVLDSGECKEIGTHDDLIMMDGCYAELFKLQNQFSVLKNHH